MIATTKQIEKATISIAIGANVSLRSITVLPCHAMATQARSIVQPNCLAFFELSNLIIITTRRGQSSGTVRIAAHEKAHQISDGLSLGGQDAWELCSQTPS